MLTQLTIRNIVLIEELALDFTGGLCVLTGETGAGKSILLDALGLVLGQRAETGLVRSGEDRASVAATFEFAALPDPLSRTFADAEIIVEPGEPLIVRRQMRADGGSKAFVNDQPVSVALLRDMAGTLVELHGQHDDRGLVNPRGHRELLDHFAGIDMASLARAFDAFRDATTALEDAHNRVQQSQDEQDLLLAHLEELTTIAPVEGEEAELAATRAAMQKGERLADDLQHLRHIFDGSDSPLASLRGATRRLDRIAEEHTLLGEALASLDRAIIEAGEAEQQLQAAADALAYDPGALDAAETRLFELRALARKHRVEADELPGVMRALRARLDGIGAETEALGELEKAVVTTGEKYRALAQTCRAQRIEGAARLDAAVSHELAPLKLDTARFHTAVTVLPEERWGRHGSDSVEFLIATNAGAKLAPLAKIASGGELSRFILALKVALAEKVGAATIIFDEIDRGVGGAVASAIGERLSRLAQTGQVLVVTHSPQVAARGDVQLVIAKTSEGRVTRTGVKVLENAARREEIARMLSGAEITDEARAQADRLLASD